MVLLYFADTFTSIFAFQMEHTTNTHYNRTPSIPLHDQSRQTSTWNMNIICAAHLPNSILPAEFKLNSKHKTISEWKQNRYAFQWSECVHWKRNEWIKWKPVFSPWINLEKICNWKSRCWISTSMLFYYVQIKSVLFYFVSFNSQSTNIAR